MDLREGRVEFVVDDLFGVDFEVLEEGLIEKAALEGVGVEVRGLDVVGQLERRVEGFLGVLFVELVAAEEVLGGGPLGADTLVFFGVDVRADAVRVVGGEKLSFFVVEARQLCSRSGGLLTRGFGQSVEVLVDGCADAVAVVVGELQRGVVPLYRLFDGFGAVVGLGAGAGVGDCQILCVCGRGGH